MYFTIASLICKICSSSAPRWTWESSSNPSHHHRVASSASSRRARQVFWSWVFIVADFAAIVVCSQDQRSNLQQENGRDEVDDFEGAAPVVRRGRWRRFLSPAVSASTARQQIWLLPPISWIYKAPCRCILAIRRRRQSSCAMWTNLARLSIFTTTRRKVVLQIHEIQGAWGNKDHGPAVEELSTVQHCWPQPCPRQDRLLGCSEVWAASRQSKLRKSERNI